MTDPEDRALSVTELSRRIRSVLEGDFSAIRVEGEVSNCRPSAAGHVYFTLKDNDAQIGCVLFRGAAQFSPAKPADGLAVTAFGDVSVYEKRGQYQLIVRSLRKQGGGSLHARFEALKAKLKEEGLFDADRKRELPPFPLTVGLVTSPHGAVLRDMLHVLRRRAPWLRVVLFPSAVQGAEAAGELAEAVARAGAFPGMDVIVVARGGGSLEDLWPFNEEIFARAVADCPVPVISGVGHETDFTISDFVADVRAPTPSVAAELLAPDQAILKRQLREVGALLDKQMIRALRRSEMDWDLAERALARVSPRAKLRDLDARAREQGAILHAAWARFERVAVRRLEAASSALAQLHPERAVARAEEKWRARSTELDDKINQRLRRAGEAVERSAALLRSLSPDAVLARGFSLTTDESGALVTDASSVALGQVISTQLAKGALKSVVESRE